MVPQVFRVGEKQSALPAEAFGVPRSVMCLERRGVGEQRLTGLAKVMRRALMMHQLRWRVERHVARVAVWMGLCAMECQLRHVGAVGVAYTAVEMFRSGNEMAAQTSRFFVEKDFTLLAIMVKGAVNVVLLARSHGSEFALAWTARYVTIRREPMLLKGLVVLEVPVA